MKHFLFFTMAVLVTCPALAKEPQRVITVSAQSEHRVAPDEAIIHFSIETLNDKLLASKEHNDSLTGAVTKAVKDLRVAAEDFKVTNLSIEPRYDNQNVIGYEVTRSFEVRTKDFAKLDRLIGGIVGAGEDSIRVDNLHIQVQDQRKHQAEARRLAVGYAKAKAADLAELNQMRLGPVISISEDVEFNGDASGFGGFGGAGISAAQKSSEGQVADAAKTGRLGTAKILLVAMPQAGDDVPSKADKPKADGQDVLSAIGQVSLNATVKIEFELIPKE